MDETRLVETTDPEEAFAALADATRVDILRALWDAECPRTFSELRTAVGMSDSGQFNYHLEQLLGRFVRKTDDGYELAFAGKQVNGAIHAGAFTMEGAVDPIELDDPCPACGGERTFHYEDEHVRIECADCDVYATAGVPPGAFAGYDVDSYPAVAARYFRTLVQQVATGFCWDCKGPVDATVVPVAETADLDEDEDVPPAFEKLPFARFDCQRCGAETTSDLGTALIHHPAVAGFHYDRGVDVRDHPFWAFSALSTDLAAVSDRDPLRARVSYDVDGATLRLVVDGDFEVIETERVE